MPPSETSVVNRKKLKLASPLEVIDTPEIKSVRVEFANPQTYAYEYIDPAKCVGHVVAVHTLPAGVESCEVLFLDDDSTKVVLTYPWHPTVLSGSSLYAREISLGLISAVHPIVTNVDAHAMTLKKTAVTRLTDSATIFLPASVRSVDYSLTYTAEKNPDTNIILIVAKINMEKEDASYTSSPKSFDVGKIL